MAHNGLCLSTGEDLWRIEALPRAEIKNKWPEMDIGLLLLVDDVRNMLLFETGNLGKKSREGEKGMEMVFWPVCSKRGKLSSYLLFI